MKTANPAGEPKNIQKEHIRKVGAPCTGVRDSSIRRILDYKQRLENIRGL